MSCEKEQELQALYSKVDTLVEANNSLQKKLLTMETELADKVSVIKQLNNQISELGVRCHQLETNNEELRKENKQYSERQVDLVFKMRNILVKQVCKCYIWYLPPYETQIIMQSSLIAL